MGGSGSQVIDAGFVEMRRVLFGATNDDIGSHRHMPNNLPFSLHNLPRRSITGRCIFQVSFAMTSSPHRKI